MSTTKPAEQPSTFAEGIPVPTPVEPTVEAAQAEVAAAPTRDDRAREWGTYRAVTDLRVGRSLAVATGGPVPASHPYLRDSHEVDENGQGGWGDGWVKQGAVELTGDYPAPDDLR